jgi:hypothetical protein
MGVADIPDTENVARYVRPTLIDRGIVTGSAFCLRKDEIGLSVNWIERIAGEIEAQLSGIRKRARINYSKNGKLAILHVGRTRSFVKSESSPECTIRIIEDPLGETEVYPADDSHALIVGIPDDGDSPEAEAIGDLIASCIETVIPSTV